MKISNLFQNDRNVNTGVVRAVLNKQVPTRRGEISRENIERYAAFNLVNRVVLTPPNTPLKILKRDFSSYNPQGARFVFDVMPYYPDARDKLEVVVIPENPYHAIAEPEDGIMIYWGGEYALAVHEKYKNPSDLENEKGKTLAYLGQLKEQYLRECSKNQKDNAEIPVILAPRTVGKIVLAKTGKPARNRRMLARTARGKRRIRQILSRR